MSSLWVALVVGCVLGVGGQEDDPHRVGTLMRHLLQDYSKHDRPAYMRPVVIDHTLAVYKLKELDIEDQKLSVLAYEVWNWEDSRLAWDPLQHSGLKEIYVPQHYLWVPDITLLMAYEKPELLSETLVTITHDGRVTLLLPRILRAICDTKDDECAQSCDLIFGSWTHGNNEIDLQPAKDSVDLTYYLPNHVWGLKSTSVERHTMKFGNPTGKFSDVTYTLNLECKNKFDGTAPFQPSDPVRWGS